MTREEERSQLPLSAGPATAPASILQKSDFSNPYLQLAKKINEKQFNPEGEAAGGTITQLDKEPEVLDTNAEESFDFLAQVEAKEDDG